MSGQPDKKKSEREEVSEEAPHIIARTKRHGRASVVHFSLRSIDLRSLALMLAAPRSSLPDYCAVVI